MIDRLEATLKKYNELEQELINRINEYFSEIAG